MTDVDIYWISGSPPAWRVLLALEYKQIRYQSHVLSAADKEHKTAEFLELNPRGQVPVIKHGDLVVRESFAILHYLNQIAPEPDLFGKTAEQGALVWQWLLDYEGNLRTSLAQVARIVFRKQIAEKAAELDRAIDAIKPELESLESTLQNNGMLMGDSLSAADITLYPDLQWLKRALGEAGVYGECSVLLSHIEKSQAFTKWEVAIQSVNNYEKTTPPHWR